MFCKFMHVTFILPRPLKLICKVLKYKYSNVLCCVIHKGNIWQLISNLNLGAKGRISVIMNSCQDVTFHSVMLDILCILLL